MLRTSQKNNFFIGSVVVGSIFLLRGTHLVCAGRYALDCDQLVIGVVHSLNFDISEGTTLTLLEIGQDY